MFYSSPSSMQKATIRAFLIFFSLQLVIGLVFFIKNFFTGQESLLAEMLRQQSQTYMQIVAQQPGYQHINSPSFSVYTTDKLLPDELLEVAELPGGIHQFDLFSSQNPDLEIELQVLIVESSSYPDFQGLWGERIYFVSQVPDPDEVFWMLDKMLGFIASYIAIAGLISMVFIWQLSKYFLQPLSRLVTQVNGWNFAAKPSELSKEFEHGDLGILAHSLDDLSHRLAEFVLRERQITRNISHELRTPLTVIRSTLDLATQKGNTAGQSEINKLKRACNELEGIIQALLWLGREQWPLEEVVNASDETNTVLQATADYLGANADSFSCNISPDIRLDCPAILFRILLNNLVQNALQHGQQPSISLTLNQQLLMVSNTQSDEQQDQASQSFGLGLDIVKQICERIGWEFQFQNHEDKVLAVVRF